MKIYLAGPMRGHLRYNFLYFENSERRLKRLGHEVINPHTLDRESGFDVRNLPFTMDWATVPPGFDMKATLLRDLQALSTCDCVALLDGWAESKGAMAERAYAAAVGIETCALERLIERLTPCVS